MNQWLILKKKMFFATTLGLLTASMCAFLMAFTLNAYGSAADPHEQVEQTTDEILALLKTGIDPVKSPDEFIKQLSDILDPVVAFDYIAKGVMGDYAENASAEQIKQFAVSFKKGLVNTYGQGVSGIKDLTIKVVPPAEPVADKRRIQVVQEVHASSGVTKISYDMGKNRQGQWKMLNLVLNGINVGQIFRSQFAAAVEKNKGDLDKTIQQWEKGV